MDLAVAGADTPETEVEEDTEAEAGENMGDGGEKEMQCALIISLISSNSPNSPFSL
jgi:hypothetical protein